jgi:hypothetical protein
VLGVFRYYERTSEAWVPEEQRQRAPILIGKLEILKLEESAVAIVGDCARPGCKEKKITNRQTTIVTMLAMRFISLHMFYKANLS